MSAALKQLDGLQEAARRAESHRAMAAELRARAPRYASPEARQHVLGLAEAEDRAAAALAPQESRLRRAIAALERALNDDGPGR